MRRWTCGNFLDLQEHPRGKAPNWGSQAKKRTPRAFLGVSFWVPFFLLVSREGENQPVVSFLRGFVGCPHSLPTADGRNPAPAKKSERERDSPVDTKRWFQPWLQSGAKWSSSIHGTCPILSRHPSFQETINHPEQTAGLEKKSDA